MPRLISRRHFLQATAASAAAAAAGVPLVRADAPSNKLNLAFIGVGGQGKSHLGLGQRENCVALCDVDRNALNAAAELFPKATKFRDYRQLFDKLGEQLDAVVIATPDHHHAPAAVRALREGLHVFCEKPIAWSVAEARLLARETGTRQLATQMGNQGHASEAIRRVVTWVHSGVLGTIKEVHTWTDRPIWPQGLQQWPNKADVPDDLDWDLWLGPAEARDYHRAIHPFNWRGYYDFGTGAIGDMGAHAWDNVWWAMNCDAPENIEAIKVVGRSDFSYPKQTIYKFDFPARGDRPAFTAHWYEGGLKPDTPAEFESDPPFGQEDYALPEAGTLYVGDKAKLLVVGNYASIIRLVPEKLHREFKPPRIEIELSPGMHTEWLLACKEEKPWDFPKSNFTASGPLCEAMLLGNVALRAERQISWDRAKMRTNFGPATQLLSRDNRKGWEV